MTTPVRRVRLEAVIDRIRPLVVLGDPTSVEVTDVVFDDREVGEGALFCCLTGAHHDGHDFAGRARAAGATAFICERSLGYEAGGAVQLVVSPGMARAAMAQAACTFFGDPAKAMRTVGVTGTNGKTTTTYFVRSILEQAGWRTGVIGTLGGARTTPESTNLQRALARQRDSGCVACALEVSSHALVQQRVDGVLFDVAVFTNLSQDHLDFHHTMEAYFSAKAELFTSERARLGVVNADDEYGRRLIDRASIPTVAFSLSDVRDLEVSVRTSQFRLGRHLVRLGLGGQFNVYNALAAAAAARALGIDPETIVAGLESAPPVPGRFESIESATGVIAVVDYAHTPAGLEQVLRSARKAIEAKGDTSSTAAPDRNGRVIVVFGAGGERDRGKRPSMGAVASQFADLVVLTADNPRSENPLTIMSEIQAGATTSNRLRREPDRRRAIALALGAARPGDVVVIAGKGHETTQQFADYSVRFDDREVVREELRRLEESDLRPPKTTDDAS